MAIKTDGEDLEQNAVRQKVLGITCEQINVYRYKTYVYHKLSDALKYAEIDSMRDEPDPEPPGVKTVTQ